MKFKLFSLALLLVCFVFLGVLSGVIPSADRDAVRTFRQLAQPSASPAPDNADAGPDASAAPRTIVPPTPRLAGTAAPVSTAVIAGPTPEPEPTAAAPSRTTVSVAGTAAPSPSAAPAAAGPTPTAEPASPTPTAGAPSPAPPETAPPAEEPEAAEIHGWEPDAEVAATTITWQEPVQNDTHIDLQDISLPEQGELTLTLPAYGPQILIIHTHGTEAYTPDGADQYEATADWRTIDTDHTVIRVGQALAAALEQCGLRVVVDTGLYDWPSYNGSYGRTEQVIKQYLEEYPDIAMIIDLHRDALGDDRLVYKTVSDELDEPAAQMMFVVGTDENLDHPNWRQNLSLAVGLQRMVEEKYPHLTRPTLLCPYRYNQQFTPGSLLLEIGTAGNTLQEAITTAELFADAVGPALAALAEE